MYNFHLYEDPSRILGHAVKAVVP